MDEPVTSPFLQGENIFLRKLTEADVTQNYVDWMNDTAVTRHLESGFFPTSSDEISGYVADQASKDTVVFLSIVEQDTGEHIGNIKLGPINWIHRRAEIGLIIGEKDSWGQGYGTEAVELLTEYAFERLNLHRVFAHCFEPNTGSKRLFEKVGYETEARLTDYVYCEGEYCDVFVLSIIGSR